MTNTETWDSAAARLAAATPRFDAVEYGPGLPDETSLRLIGEPATKRVLDLGCGLGQSAIALVRQGAHVIAIDASDQMLHEAQQRAQLAEVTVEWHHSDLADLAFLRAESIDVALAIDALDEVEDIDRVLRQVHRVLRPNAPFVFTLEHPMHAALRTEGEGAPGGLPLGRLVVNRAYHDAGPVIVERSGVHVTVHPRTVETVFSALHRAGYRVDQILEPESLDSPSQPAVPTTIIWRARKLGS